MSHVCAKPACTEPVLVWFDFAPVSQKVIERADRSDVSVGLCEMHASRFTVPDGWSFERVADETPEAESTVDRSPAAETADASSPSVPKNRTSTRDRPWFLALRDDDVVETTSEPSIVVGPVTTGSSQPTMGSLLHRAFHGPDRDVDVERAARDQHDELESRRVARDTDGYSPAELPFPPFEPEHRAAVS